MPPCFSVRIPVIKGDNMALLSQNYLNEQMLKTHPHKIIGYITCTVRLDPGLVSSPSTKQTRNKANTFCRIRITKPSRRRQTQIDMGSKYTIISKDKLRCPSRMLMPMTMVLSTRKNRSK